MMGLNCLGHSPDELIFSIRRYTLQEKKPKVRLRNSKQRVRDIRIQFFVEETDAAVVAGYFKHINSRRRIVFLIYKNIDLLIECCQVFCHRLQLDKVGFRALQYPGMKIGIRKYGSPHTIQEQAVDLLEDLAGTGRNLVL